MIDAGKTMTLRLTEEMAGELEFVARVRGIPVSQAVRHAVARYLNDLSQDRGFQARLQATMREEQQTLERITRRAGTALVPRAAEPGS